MVLVYLKTPIERVRSKWKHILFALIVVNVIFILTFIRYEDFRFFVTETFVPDPFYSRLVFAEESDRGEDYRQFVATYFRGNVCPEASSTTTTYPSSIHLKANGSKSFRHKHELDLVSMPSPLNQSTGTIPVASVTLPFIHSIAIVLAITTKHRSDPQQLLDKPSMMKTMPFFQSLLPSFCQTASSYYDYHFFLAYDVDDPNMTRKQFVSDMSEVTMSYINTACPSNSRYTFRFVLCPYIQMVTWAQNDAALEAYIAGIEYIYRINDDTEMMTPGWTETFISILRHLHPPNVGICGPNHSRGNRKVLTYEFVHRTHIDILGCYYPRELKNWDGDVWITTMYRPERSFKVTNVTLVHTQEHGRRYDATKSNTATLDHVIAKAKAMIDRYVIARLHEVKPDPRKVIAMAVNITNLTNMWGAIRNAQLRLIHFPDWTIRVYLSCDVTNIVVQERSVNLTENILGTLRYLGAEIHIVDAKVLHTIPKDAWNFLVMNDPKVDLFIVRSPEKELNQLDAQLVSACINSTEGNKLYIEEENKSSVRNSRSGFPALKPNIKFAMTTCDNVSHGRYSVLPDLWAGQPHLLKSFVQGTMNNRLFKNLSPHKDVGPIFETGGILSKVNTRPL